jgi:hypothetical protein
MHDQMRTVVAATLLNANYHVAGYRAPWAFESLAACMPAHNFAVS